MEFLTLEIANPTKKLSLTFFSTENGQQQPHEVSVRDMPQAFWKAVPKVVKSEYIETLKQRVSELRSKAKLENNNFHSFLTLECEYVPENDEKQLIADYDKYQISRMRDCLGKHLEMGDAVVFSDKYRQGNIVGVYYGYIGKRNVNYLVVKECGIENHTDIVLPHLTVKF